MRIAAAVFTLLIAPAAFADPKPAPPPQKAPATEISGPVSDDCARARKHNQTCVLDMGGETLEGDVAKNTGIDTTLLKFGTQSSLIRIRRDFIAEIVKTADDL